jgi:RecA/RadA recombinase
MNAPQPIAALDVETIRFSLERQLAEVLSSFPGFALRRSSLVSSDPEGIRRRLVAGALRLTATMAPAAYAQANEARHVLAIDGELELYQSSGRENAALHLVEAPILLEIQGRMLSLLDHAAGVALFGHELGHFLAHGPWTDLGATAIAGMALAESGVLPAAQADAARRLAVAREITADRFGLIACRDLDAALRLEMIATTGLSGESLTWDTAAYLAQSRELMERTIGRGEAALATTHPEHSLRAWALWLFSESDVYRRVTGSGPGTRPIADVDAAITQSLGAPDLDLGYDGRDEPPAFLAECALAGAVLVAAADGVISPEELDAIEDAFGRTVPGWSELLDPEVALQRFHDTGGMVRAGGADLVRTLFLLLTHVMGADDVVDAREIQMVLAIGEALGHGAEFRRWIRPSIEAMKSPLELELLDKVAIPLPVRKHEVSDAIAALCDSVDRRGEATIALRRLFRLVGAEPQNPAGLDKVTAAFAQRGIQATPALADADLDQIVRLTATHRIEAARPPELDASRGALVASLSRLRDELVSGDGRSPAVRLRRLVRGRVFDLTQLDRIRAGTAERTLALVTEGRRATLVTADDAGTHDAAESCSEDLRALHRENRDRVEETGANDLYLGYPLVVGNVAPRGTTTPGYGVRAPLVLYPVVLERDGRGARGFSLSRRKDEDPIANQSLVRIIFNKANLALPDELSRELDEIAADPARGTKAILAKLREVGVTAVAESTTLLPFADRDKDLDEAAPFLAIEECALLGIFPQSSSDLLQDYDALLKDLGDPTRDAATLLASAVAVLPAGAVADSNDAPAAAAIGWPVLAADPSQRAVLARCLGNRVTVVDGPPGTGKSQLIVNLVADALRRGERVAVVAEKRAALDVVGQRLEGCGLGSGIAVVHDVHEDRKSLFEKIRLRLEAQPESAGPAPRLEIVRQEYEAACRALDADGALLAQSIGTTSLTAGQLVALSTSGVPGFADPVLADLDLDALRRTLELTERLHPHQDLWSPAAWWRSRGAARGSLRELDDAAISATGARVRAAIALADAYERTVANAATSQLALVDAQDGLAATRDALTTCASPTDVRMLTALIARGDAGIGELAQMWTERASALARWTAPTGLAVDDELTRQVAVLRSFVGQIGRVFSPLWWSTRAAVRRALAHAWPERASAGFTAELLDELTARIEASRAWAGATALFERLGIPDLAPKDSASAHAALVRLRELAAIAVRMTAAASRLAAIEVTLPLDAAAFATLADRVGGRTTQLEALLALRNAVRDLLPLFPWLATPTAEALRALAGRFELDGHRLREVDGWLALMDEALAPAVKGSAQQLLDHVVGAAPQRSFTEWRESIARAWAHAHLDRARAANPRLAELGTLAADQRSERSVDTMLRLEPEIRALEVARIAAQLADAELLRIPTAGFRARRTDEQKGKEALLKEVSKKSRLLPLRRFVRDFAAIGLLDVLPCWLLSPETMAVLFPREPLFDLVIFDEASQCTVESGLPVMLRAKRVVIAGDEKQMPPSSFFVLGSQSTDDEDRSEQELVVRDAFAAESLLALARARCPHAALAWHYRCRDESLIAFSNHAMYEGELLTIPSTHGPGAAPALRWIEVTDGCYEAGLNRPEAVRVVELIAELLARPVRATIGVVTFNLRQRQSVLEAIEARVGTDDAFAEHWRAANEVEAIDQRPFIKNLESVQGDERDVIIFSLGHAPIERTRKGGKAELYVPARFGPLGQRGGERRLNVAISRAKAECYIVASFDPKLLHVGDALHDGPRLFKAYLEFAYELSHGRRVQAQRVLDDVRGRRMREQRAEGRALVDGHVPLAAQIALAVEASGLRCELGLGSSHFRIPLVIGRSDASDFRLAVLTDEGSSGADAFERYLHRPSVLALRGWDVMHVSATTWARRPSDVIAEIERRMA